MNTTGADAIQEIMAKGQKYITQFKESGINQNFTYKTKLLDIPRGSDENFKFIEEQDEEIESKNGEANERLKEQLANMTNKLYKKQYKKFMNLNEIVWQSA
jgi:hypothetical protein